MLGAPKRELELVMAGRRPHGQPRACAETLSPTEQQQKEEEEKTMCEGCGCANPDKQKEKPEECTPEQIKKCHPESEGHPCEGGSQDD
jgi:hypothetical protein